MKPQAHNLRPARPPLVIRLLPDRCSLTWSLVPWDLVIPCCLLPAPCCLPCSLPPATDESIITPRASQHRGGGLGGGCRTGERPIRREFRSFLRAARSIRRVARSFLRVARSFLRVARSISRVARSVPRVVRSFLRGAGSSFRRRGCGLPETQRHKGAKAPSLGRCVDSTEAADALGPALALNRLFLRCLDPGVALCPP